MTEETWRVILSQEGGAGEGAGGGGAGGAGAGSGETPNQRKTLFEDAGKVFGAIASTAGMLAILIRSIGGSTVASTFMEVVFKILGALWDLFLINFLPIFMVLVRWLLSLMPVVQALGEALKPLIELIAEKLEGLLNAVTEWIVPRLLELAKAITSFATTGDISPLLAWGEKFFKDLFEIAGKLFMDLITWVKTNGPEIVASIGKSVNLFADWLKKEGPTIMNTIVSGIKIMKDTLDPLYKQLVAVFGPILKEIFAPLEAYFKEVGAWIESEIFKPIKDYIVGPFMTWVGGILIVFFKNLALDFGHLVESMAAKFGFALVEVLQIWKPWAEKQAQLTVAMAEWNKNNPADKDRDYPLLEAFKGFGQKEFPQFVASQNAQTAAILKVAGNTAQTAQNTSTLASQGVSGGIGVNATFEPHNNALRQQQAGCVGLSNQAQTGQVVVAQWTKNIYESMTGQKWVG